METRTIVIRGMSCNHCVMNVRKRLEMLPGVAVNELRIGEAVIAFDPARTTGAEIDAAIEDERYAVVR